MTGEIYIGGGEKVSKGRSRKTWGECGEISRSFILPSGNSRTGQWRLSRRCLERSIIKGKSRSRKQTMGRMWRLRWFGLIECLREDDWRLAFRNREVVEKS